MKKATLQKLLFIISVSFLCTNAIAQGPADPGNDPIVSSNEPNENIILPQHKTEVKNDEKTTYILENVPAVRTHESLESKIHFSDFSVKKYDQRFKTTIFFSNADENERRLKLMLPLVLFTPHQI